MKPGVRIGATLCLAALVAPAAGAADKDAVERAVDRAAAYLRSTQQADGTWRHSEIGATVLCGLALLESGARADDPAVQKAAKAVREASVSCTKTYSLSLSIMFLDRLGDEADAELIESMAVRLLAGQDPGAGGWSYDCPPLSDAEVQRLQGALRRRAELVARPVPEAPKGRPTVRDLPKEIQVQLQQALQQQAGAGAPRMGSGDNSNTQFAVLALWIARRKGIPVETALARLDGRFRRWQEPDGGWTYYVNLPYPTAGRTLEDLDKAGQVSTPTMTCAGLLGLALSHGSALEVTLRAGPAGGAPAPARGTAARDISSDPAVKKGLLALGAFLGKAAQAADKPGNGARPILPAPWTGKGYYFLFSLERVAVAYGLETIGDKDWYNWGADILLNNQNADGSWAAEYPGADTCFGILFLRRANLAQDLTATLKGRVADPGHELRAIDPATIGKGGGPKPPAAEGDKGDTPKETRPAASAVSPEAAHLSEELVKADPARQAEVLRKLRDGKGAIYTDALAHAIRRLDGPARGQARDALADRLTRMKKDTLDDKLRDDDLEVRRAAALAAAMKDERAFVPRLIEMLQDPEADVARAAHAALKSLTNQDFGPARDATRAEVARAAAAWKEWWGKNGDR
jgi:hypothetical protein